MIRVEVKTNDLDIRSIKNLRYFMLKNIINTGKQCISYTEFESKNEAEHFLEKLCKFYYGTLNTSKYDYYTLILGKLKAKIIENE